MKPTFPLEAAQTLWASWRALAKLGNGYVDRSTIVGRNIIVGHGALWTAFADHCGGLRARKCRICQTVVMDHQIIEIRYHTNINIHMHMNSMLHDERGKIIFIHAFPCVESAHEKAEAMFRRQTR